MSGEITSLTICVLFVAIHLRSAAETTTSKTDANNPRISVLTASRAQNAYENATAATAITNFSGGSTLSNLINADSKTDTSDVTTTSSSSLCTEGCLMCSSNEKCLFCDYIKSFYLTDGACSVKPRLDNCDLRNLVGDCIICSIGFYLDNGKCVAVPTGSVIAECEYYNYVGNVFSCVLCKVGYILSANTCTKVKTLITGCRIYDSDGLKCVECLNGLPNMTFDECDTSKNTTPNCVSYNPITCQECNTGYIYDVNYYSKQFMLNEFSSPSTAYSRFLKTLATTGLNIALPVCRVTEVKNCDKFINYNKCSVCKNFFYLSNGICKPYPNDQIDNCEEYKSVNWCKTCEQRYYITISGTCKAVTPIEFCAEYSKIENLICNKCQDGYVSKGSTCEIRRVLDTNCTEYYLDRDLCKNCTAGFVPDLGMVKCLTGIKNCKIYTVTNTTATCVSCIDDYTQSGQECVLGGIANCRDYSSATQCLVCKIGYYRDSQGLCQDHTLKERIICDDFSTDMINYCNTCAVDRIGFTLNNICMEVDIMVADCIKYSSNGTCYSCNSETSYLNGNTCVKGGISKCSLYKRDSKRCVKCTIDTIDNVGYIINKDEDNNKCVMNNPNVYYNCGSILDTIGKECDFCNEQYYPMAINSTDTQYCVPTDYYEITTTSLLENCKVYNTTTNKCEVCSADITGIIPALSSAGSCVTSCASNEAIQTVSIVENSIKKKFFCKKTSEFTASSFTSLFNINCKRFNNDYNLGSDVCAECPSGTIGVFDFDKGANLAYQYSYLLTTSVDSSSSFFNRISVINSCISSTTSLSVTNASSTILSKSANLVSSKAASMTNCRFLSKTPDDASKYYCNSCRFGFSGKVYADTESKTYLIESCDIIPSCMSDVWYGGLGGYPGQMSQDRPYSLDLYASCHKCRSSTDSELIPTYALPLSKITTATPKVLQFKLSPWGFNISSNLVTPFNLAVTHGETQTSCKVLGLSQASTFPKNCGVQQVDPSKLLGGYDNSTANTSSNPICVACKPAFKPTSLSSTIPGAIDGCVSIANCSLSSEFNRCTQCTLGYAVRDGSHFQECTQSADNNCYMVSNDGASCVKCKKSFILNVDGKCDSMQLLSCSTHGFMQFPRNLEETYMLYWDGMGCEKCTSSVGILFAKPQTYCIKNPILKASTKIDTGSTFKYKIDNCMYYSFSNDDIVCKKCAESFILQVGSKSCVATAAVPSCDIAQIGGFVCKYCSAGFYLNSQLSVCLKGSIYKCKYYSAVKICKECESGYTPVTLAGKTSVCFDLTSTKCSILDQTKASLGIIDCQTCVNDYYISTEVKYGIFPLKDCISVPPVQNCEVYEKGLSPLLSSLLCATCKQGFYSDQARNACVTRNKIIEGCVEYNTKADSCSVCQKNRYLTTDKSNCSLNPSGITGCAEYTEGDVCTKCGKSMYLKEGTCREVLKSNLLDNCRYYLNDTECSQCSKNYISDGKVCRQAIASNCKTYLSSDKCKDCETGYGLSTVSSIRSCVLVQVTNCEIPNYSSPGPVFTCLKCAKNYYLVGGTCAEVTKKITKCEYYNSSAKCSKCESGYVLDNTGDKCMEVKFMDVYIDGNCVNSKIDLKCNSCELGYYMAPDFTCKICEGVTGCAFCDPDNNKTCYMCQTGYIHTSTKTCITGASGSNDSDKSAMITKWVFTISLLCLLFTLN